MLKHLKGFLKNHSGNVAMSGALVIVPMIAAVGATIDYTGYVGLRDHVQNSLDAAGLAAGRELAAGATEAQLEAYSETFFEANLQGKANPDEYEFGFQLNLGDSSVNPPIPSTISLTADLEYDTIFGDWLGVDKITEQISSLISLGNRTVEVALVMDNSGSMGSNNRLQTMKDATTDLVNTIFSSATLTHLPDPVQFSIIPFSGSVNIGPEYWNAKWMDRKGWAPVHHENFDWENTYRTSNNTRVPKYNGVPRGFQERIDGSWTWKRRLDVFEMLGTEWAGCVEMRPWPYNTTDDVIFSNQNYSSISSALNSADDDGDGVADGLNALFVHYFAPDEPDRDFAEDKFSNGSVDHDPDDDRYANDYLYDFTDTIQHNGETQLYTDIHNPNPAFGINGATNQVQRTNWMFKYQVNDQYRGGMSTSHGPNDGCRSLPITKLTDNQQNVEDEIDDMIASGTTNIQQGLTWGWRTLSPTLPFSEGREYDDDQNMKIIILLTDGNNFYSTDGDSTPNQTAYGAWGYARTPDVLKHPLYDTNSHNRWLQGLDASSLAGTIYETTTFDMTPESNSDFELIMNAHTNQACNNIKTSGVTIYTIAFDVSDGSSVKNLLQACAGSGLRDGTPIITGVQFYHDVNGPELEQAMADIANQIANLRIAQ